MKPLFTLVLVALCITAAWSQPNTGTVMGPHKGMYDTFDVRFETAWNLHPRDALWIWRNGVRIGQAVVIANDSYHAIVLSGAITPLKGDRVTFYHRAAPIDRSADDDPYATLDQLATMGANREFVQISNMPFGAFPPGQVWGVPFAYPQGGAAPRRR